MKNAKVSHIHFMRRAIDIAKNGRGLTSPNPMVGCVIVYENRIIGEGWHKKYGGPHAEVNAIDSVKNKSLLSKSTIYVTLEPCSHYGKTPPCADLIIKYKPKAVVISNIDPNPTVKTNGIYKLKEAGIEVITGIMEKEARYLNRRFFTIHEKKRPYIILKWAETADGFIAKENGDSKWISNNLSRKVVHQWRSEEDAILVGTNTAKKDNPKLNTRDWSGKSPLRIVIDKKLILSKKLSLFDQSINTICYNSKISDKTGVIEYVKLKEHNFIDNMLHDLTSKKINSVIIEGGSQLINSFLEQNTWDEARVFTSQKHFKSGIRAPKINIEPTGEIKIKEDLLRIIRNFN